MSNGGSSGRGGRGSWESGSNNYITLHSEHIPVLESRAAVGAGYGQKKPLMSLGGFAIPGERGYGKVSITTGNRVEYSKSCKFFAVYSYISYVENEVNKSARTCWLDVFKVFYASLRNKGYSIERIVQLFPRAQNSYRDLVRNLCDRLIKNAGETGKVSEEVKVELLKRWLYSYRNLVRKVMKAPVEEVEEGEGGENEEEYVALVVEEKAGGGGGGGGAGGEKMSKSKAPTAAAKAIEAKKPVKQSKGWGGGGGGQIDDTDEDVSVAEEQAADEWIVVADSPDEETIEVKGGFGRSSSSSSSSGGDGGSGSGGDKKRKRSSSS